MTAKLILYAVIALALVGPLVDDEGDNFVSIVLTGIGIFLFFVGWDLYSFGQAFWAFVWGLGVALICTFAIGWALPRAARMPIAVLIALAVGFCKINC